MNEILELYGTALLCKNSNAVKLCEAIFSEFDECVNRDECCERCKYEEEME